MVLFARLSFPSTKSGRRGDDIHPYVPIPLKNDTYVFIANGSKFSAGGIGTLLVIMKKKTPIRIGNLLYVSDLDRRLVPIPALA